MAKMAKYRITTQEMACYTIPAASPLMALFAFRREHNGAPVVEIAKVIRGGVTPLYRVTPDGSMVIKI